MSKNTKITLEERIQDLMLAVYDVNPSDGKGLVQSITNAAAGHRSLFDVYVKELRQAKQTAEIWWQSLIDAETSRVGVRHEAEINVKLRRPAGCVVHPRVIHIIRHFWLECLRMNEKVRQQDRVAPEIFILRWLKQTGEEELAEFVTTFPFWPMGMNGQGNWI